MEVILMIGIPGSGKTTLAKAAFPSHVHVSLDRIRELPPATKLDMLSMYRGGPRPKLSKERKIEHIMMANALKEGRNIVVDDTNVTRDIRRLHIGIAARHRARVNAVFFQNIPRAYARNKSRRRTVNKKAMDRFCRILQPPHESEGFGFIQIMY